MNYGIEYEFFVLNKDGIIVPAYKATQNIDGNPVIGELRTKVHNNILDCVFELKKLIYKEKEALVKKGFVMYEGASMQVSDDFLKANRADAQYTDRKTLTALQELSIYRNGKTGKILPKGLLKASLQVNFSNNKEFSYNEYEKVTVEDKSKYVVKQMSKSYAGLFDFVSIIAKLDEAFSESMITTGRTKGVYAIKPGELGDRIEYRSLPNAIDIDKLITVLG